jgi:hypothetical protein
VPTSAVRMKTTSFRRKSVDCALGGSSRTTRRKRHVRRIVGSSPDAPNRLGETPAACGELKPYSVRLRVDVPVNLSECNANSPLPGKCQDGNLQL